MREYRSKKRNEALRVRRMAEANGEWKYQGTPCKHGHGGLRYSSTGRCVDCNACAYVPVADRAGYVVQRKRKIKV